MHPVNFYIRMSFKYNQAVKYFVQQLQMVLTTVIHDTATVIHDIPEVQIVQYMDVLHNHYLNTDRSFRQIYIVWIINHYGDKVILLPCYVLDKNIFIHTFISSHIKCILSITIYITKPKSSIIAFQYTNVHHTHSNNSNITHIDGYIGDKILHFCCT